MSVAWPGKPRCNGDLVDQPGERDLGRAQRAGRDLGSRPDRVPRQAGGLRLAGPPNGASISRLATPTTARRRRP